MFKGGVDTFVLVINYLDEAWTFRHATIGLFEVHETSVVPWFCSSNLY
jgi:hypothetical protein